MTEYRIVLADDHRLVRQGLRRIIDSGLHLRVIGEADDGLALVALLRSRTADLVVLDISMPRLRGIEAIREVKAVEPNVKILMLSMHTDTEYVLESMAAGAHGYLLKQDAETELFAAIDKIRRGGVYISPRLVDAVTSQWATGRRVSAGPVSADGEALTLREREVLKLTAEGKTSKETADILCISHRTVEHHRAKISAKLGIKRTADLMKYAITRGYLQ